MSRATKEKIVNRLVSVKSIVTLLLVTVFCYLACNDKISSELFMGIFSTVITFYFTSQIEKKEGKDQTTTK